MSWEVSLRSWKFAHSGISLGFEAANSLTQQTDLRDESLLYLDRSRVGLLRLLGCLSLGRGFCLGAPPPLLSPPIQSEIDASMFRPEVWNSTASPREYDSV